MVDDNPPSTGAPIGALSSLSRMTRLAGEASS
jgi:hypothetical protein